jgi:GTP cyclohydrolase I
MKDVQNQIDERDVFLDQVGIKDFVFPMQIRNKHGEWNSTAANISLFVGLAANQKGTHMSRFVDIIQQNRKMDLKHMRRILEQIRERLEAETSYIVMKFDYFIEKDSPVTHIPSLVNVKVEYRASLIGDDCSFDMKVITPVTTLCPCSKEISDYSAHNQRADVSIDICSNKFLWIEDLVEIAEKSASSPIYSLLKRPDEKYVTEHAYDNPRFVEDVCREAKLLVCQLPDVQRYTIEVESFESIHNHSAYARVSG